ncbi:MAG: hypothetical protein LBI10_05565 [Deltaproteobacteria bacterium]|jgi:exopolyphosphatase/guanosine-5'-triphosphate,3'-diphosphate pyrophosphatase|nr:hypothetical protein [Deltaproteobacteria bacterium]
MPNRPLAALDLGSNTFRLILAQSDDFGQGLLNRRVWQEIPRIAEGLAPGGSFAAEPLKRAIAALETFQTQIDQSQPSRVLAGATMAFRLAKDGEAVLKAIQSRFGWETRLLSGQEEARLSAYGVLSGLKPLLESGLIFDIGGRSTEFIKTHGQTLVTAQSLNLGVVSLTEDHIHADPPTTTELAALTKSVAASLKTLNPDLWPLDPNATLVGTAGTVTTVAAMLMDMADYDGDLVNNQVFKKADIVKLFDRLTRLPIAHRQRTPGLHPKRADVIVAGLALVLAILDFFQRDTLMVSDNSLLEGLWLVAAGRTHL